MHYDDKVALFSAAQVTGLFEEFEQIQFGDALAVTAKVRADQFALPHAGGDILGAHVAFAARFRDALACFLVGEEFLIGGNQVWRLRGL